MNRRSVSRTSADAPQRSSTLRASRTREAVSAVRGSSRPERTRDVAGEPEDVIRIEQTHPNQVGMRRRLRVRSIAGARSSCWPKRLGLLRAAGACPAGRRLLTTPRLSRAPRRARCSVGRRILLHHGLSASKRWGYRAARAPLLAGPKALALAGGSSAGLCLWRRPYNHRLHQTAPREHRSHAGRDEPLVTEEVVAQRTTRTIDYTPGIEYTRGRQFGVRFITA